MQLKAKAWQNTRAKSYFMENAVPGDIVTVRLIKNKKDWAEGQVIRVKPIPRKGFSLFASILESAGVVSGRCFLMKNSWSTNRTRFYKA